MRKRGTSRLAWCLAYAFGLPVDGRLRIRATSGPSLTHSGYQLDGRLRIRVTSGGSPVFASVSARKKLGRNDQAFLC